MSEPEHSEFLQVALAAADQAETIIRHYFNSGIEVRHKADASPVTQADEESEAAIRATLKAAFPAHGFYGEESGSEALDADYLWLVDPIDGTKAFVRGYPIFSVQIALMHKGELIMGLSSAPCWNGGQGERVYAERGKGAWRNGERLQVSAISELGKSTLSTGNIATLAASPRWAALGQLIGQVHRIRGYGDFLHYHWLAAGHLDVVVESDVNILDIAALAVIVREAGGDFTDLEGAELTLKTTSVLASNGRLRKAVVEALNRA